jgi:hypothetical protein
MPEGITLERTYVVTQEIVRIYPIRNLLRITRDM